MPSLKPDMTVFPEFHHDEEVLLNGKWWCQVVFMEKATTTISSSSSFLVKIVVPFLATSWKKSSLGSNVAMESSRIFS